MFTWLTELSSNSSHFMPHGACYLWQQSILLLHVISDALIASAYYSIPIALGYFVHRRTDLTYRWVFVLFGCFILLCGTTHLLSIWTIWYPNYWLAGWIKAITAFASCITAVLIWPLIPKLLSLPSPEALASSEAYMRAIFDCTPDSILITDNKGVITMVNHEAQHLLGYQHYELIGTTIDNLLHESSKNAFASLRAHCIDNATIDLEPITRTFSVLTKFSHEIEVSLRFSTINTKQGLYFACTLRDITQEKQAENALKASEERFRLMANASPTMIWITDASGKFSFINQTWLNFTGITAADALNRDCHVPLIHPDDQAIYSSAYEHICFSHHPITFEYRMRKQSNDWRWILDHAVPLHDNKGEFCGYIGSALDITERKQAEAEFRIAAAAFESQEAMVITDTETVILRVNKTFCDTTGYSVEELVGKKMHLLKSGRHDDAFYKDMWHQVNTVGAWQGEVWDKRKNGEIYPKWLTITAVKDSHGATTHYVGTHIDISERKAQEDEIKLLAYYDSLTQLPNRRLLRDRLQQALTNAKRHKLYGALLFIDLDNFKTLNDTLGHDIGDLLLVEVANRLMLCIRETDTIARLGGDEFIVMLENISDNATGAALGAEAVAQKIIALLNQPYHFSGHEHHSSPSIGITLFSADDETVDSLLKQSDIAMYQAKAAGRNTLRFFNADMQAAVTDRALLEEDLHKGILEQQFTLYYQAQVDQSGRIIGCEVLVRWYHPLRNFVTPADFIPLAEETGLIIPLGLWVLSSACKQLATWANNPTLAHLTIAVNVSVNQFKQDNFIDQVLTAVRQSGANPNRLKLELTESLIASDLDDIIKKMKALKQAGISFALDDFGTGFSSLNYLKRLPFDQLKIDQSFVKNILTEQNDAAIATVIIKLADSLGLQVIAEGVETQAQLDLLSANGCPYYQGYLFNKPCPVEEFERLFDSMS